MYRLVDGLEVVLGAPPCGQVDALHSQHPAGLVHVVQGDIAGPVPQADRVTELFGDGLSIRHRNIGPSPNPGSHKPFNAPTDTWRRER
ncbi:hypothetical protein GCM10027038_27480 [Arthrobacter bambusae]